MVYHKILVIGNACSGKTNLSQFISNNLDIPVTHVDSLQFDKNLNIKPYKETTEILNQIMLNNRWIIDGFGPLDNLIERFNQADQIIFIDLPIIFNYFWATLRQLKNIISKTRFELPEGSSERSFQHTLKLYKSIYQIHNKMRPELLRIIHMNQYKDKVLLIRTFKHYKSLFDASIV